MSFKQDLYVDDFLNNTQNRKGAKLKKVKGKVIHGTANFGVNANAKANRNYFQRTDRYASSQEITDEKMILRAMPSDEVAWHVGGKRYTKLGNSLREGGYTPNYFLIGEEICVHKNGDFHQTLINSMISSINLMHEYGFTEEQIYRHYDITGKLCPSFMISDKEFIEYKQRVRYLYQQVYGANPNLLDPVIIPELMKVQVRNNLNVRKGPGTEFEVAKTLKDGDLVTAYELVNNFFHIGEDLWVHSKYVVEAAQELFFEELQLGDHDLNEVYRVINPNRALFHEEPKANSPIMHKANNGEEIIIDSFVNDWGKTAFGYVHMTDVEPTQEREVIKIGEDDVLYTDPEIGSKIIRVNDLIKPIGTVMDKLYMNNVAWEAIKLLGKEYDKFVYRQQQK